MRVGEARSVATRQKLLARSLPNAIIYDKANSPTRRYTHRRMPSARSDAASNKASASARSTASNRAAALARVQKSARDAEAKKIEEMLKVKEMEIMKLREDLAKTKSGD